MKIHKLNFDFRDGFREALLEVCKRDIVFIRPFGAKLFRVYATPLDSTTELVQVLNTLCTRYSNGVWYFRILDVDICDTLHHMGFDNLVVEPEESQLN